MMKVFRTIFFRLNKRLSLKHAFMLGLVFSFVFSGCDNKNPEEKFEITPASIIKGPIVLSIKAQKKELSILDTQKVVLEVEAPEGIDLSFPALDERLEDFARIPWKADYEKTEKGIFHSIKYFAFELYQSGPQIIPPLEIHYSSGSGENQISGTLKTPILRFMITSLGDDSLWKETLHPVTAPVELESFPWWYIAIAVLVFCLVLLVVIKIFRKAKTKIGVTAPPPTPAHIKAYRELQILVDRQKKDEIDSETFVSEICDVLRRYIERRFSLRAPEQTSEEFLESMMKGSTPLSEFKEPLQVFMNHTDMIKFADVNATEEDIQKGFDFIKDFIEKTKKEERIS